MYLSHLLCGFQRSMRSLYQSVVVNNYQKVQSLTFVRMSSKQSERRKAT